MQPNFVRRTHYHILSAAHEVWLHADAALVPYLRKNNQSLFQPNVTPMYE